MGAEHVPPLAFNAARSVIAFVFLLVLCAVMRSGRRKGQAASVTRSRKDLLLGGFWCGLTLGLASFLQQKGLDTTSPGKAGFITALYIVLVPMIGLALGRRTGWLVWAAVAVAIGGLWFLCVPPEGFSVRLGDLYTLLCAFVFSLHILVISHFVTKVNGVELACGQFVCGSIIASAAVLMLIFKDSILGLVAGVQLSANDMLRPGDWITMSKYGADGYVIEVTLTTVKVQNFDKTITTIPPYALVSDSFQNWRGMRECGGRRIKRSVFIDARTIRRCTPEETARLREKGYLAADTSQEIVNLQALREYLANYLRNCPDVRSDLMLMVRTLQPTSEGVPLEFYCFTRHFEWIPYEAFQSALTDRVLTLLPEFGLQAFQRPAGTDLHERH